VIGNAVRVTEIATGQRDEENDAADEAKDPRAAHPRAKLDSLLSPLWSALMVLIISWTGLLRAQGSPSALDLVTSNSHIDVMTEGWRA
jgi:hypothetical protein